MNFTKSPGKPHVVVVDDEEDMTELLALRLEHHGYRVTTACNVPDAIAPLGREQVDAMVVDLRLDEASGLDVLDEVRERALDVAVIILTAHGTIETAVEAMKRGAYGFLTKPFHDHDLLQKLAQSVDSVRLRREVAGLRGLVGDEPSEPRLLGTSEGIKRVRALVERLAPTDATVLVLGESGTGKEVVARMLHAASNRSRAPFVALNCAAIPGELLESELFGHVRGAFTGAARDKDGLFAAAEGGTLFLDEVGDAPLAVQAKFLRVLQEQRFTPVGSSREVRADVRVVAATNKELRREVAEGRFREDLFYRLHVVPVLMPPLRERPGDIPLLAREFLVRSAARHGRPGPALSPEAVSLLSNHSWPGNVRELANVMEGAVLLASEGTLHAADLFAVMPQAGTTPSVESALRAPSLNGPMPPLREARTAFERAYLEETLRRSSGNVSAAARLAGRNRTDMHDLLRKHGLSSDDFRSE